MSAPKGGSPTTVIQRITSFFQDIIPLPNTLGDAWQGGDASEAVREGNLSSQTAGASVRIAFRNLAPVPLLLCWISENGDLHHFYNLNPSTSTSIMDGAASPTIIMEGDHIEHSCGGHSFCLAYLPRDQRKEAQRLKSLPDVSAVVAGYRPFRNCKPNQIHLVTIEQKHRSENTNDDKDCCGGPLISRLRNRRGKFTFVQDQDTVDADSEDSEWIVDAKLAKIDPTPWDTSTKVYELRMLGSWPVYAEPNWFNGDTRLEKRLANDLREASKVLPTHAVEYLRRNCPIWVNSCIKYGPKACPIKGRGCCYHPDKQWLIENGLSERKHKCIEINDGPGYKDNVEMWGPGGLLVHELCHAYHHRMLPDGYNNKEILSCYKQAMKEKLYEKVKVHGPQGPEAKAYACSNDKEYFAELSTAFLGCKDGSKEYNKWYPFNREQLRDHDPRAYKLLSRLWREDLLQ